MAASKLPDRATMERLRSIDWRSVIDRYMNEKRQGEGRSVSKLEISDAVCALYYAHGWTGKAVSELIGEKVTSLGSAYFAYAFLTDEVRALADPSRPQDERLSPTDVDTVFRMPRDRQLRAAQNLIAGRRQRKPALIVSARAGFRRTGHARYA